MALGCVLSCSGDVLEDESRAGHAPERYGLGLVSGITYKPTNDREFIQISGFALLKHDAIWPYYAPESLRLKLECRLGISTHPDVRCMASAGPILLYYFGEFGHGRFRPFAEGGCHIIYTDFQVHGQGLRVNFNPQIGIGAEFDVGPEQSFYLAFGLQHISNARLTMSP